MKNVKALSHPALAQDAFDLAQKNNRLFCFGFCCCFFRSDDSDEDFKKNGEKINRELENSEYDQKMER